MAQASSILGVPLIAHRAIFGSYSKSIMGRYRTINYRISWACSMGLYSSKSFWLFYVWKLYWGI